MMMPGKNSPEGTQTPYVVMKKKNQTIVNAKLSYKVRLSSKSTIDLMVPPSVLKSRVARGLYYPSGQRNCTNSVLSSTISWQFELDSATK